MPIPTNPLAVALCACGRRDSAYSETGRQKLQAAWVEIDVTPFDGVDAMECYVVCPDCWVKIKTALTVRAPNLTRQAYV